MRKNSRTLLALEERLKLAAGSQAVSPETAAKLVQRLSQIHTACFFGEKTDLTAMYELIGEFMEAQDLDILSYPGLCCALQRAILRDTEPFRRPDGPPAEMDHPYRPAWGVRADNALILLGLMLLDHARGRRKGKDIYHCTRMTLKQYPDPGEYFSDLAHEYPVDVPDPGQGDVPRAVRNRILISRRDYRPDTLRALAAKSPSPELRELLENSISEARLAAAMQEIDFAAVDLYMLWVEPYLWIEDPDAAQRNFDTLRRKEPAGLCGGREIRQ